MYMLRPKACTTDLAIRVVLIITVIHSPTQTQIRTFIYYHQNKNNNSILPLPSEQLIELESEWVATLCAWKLWENWDIEIMQEWTVNGVPYSNTWHMI